MILALLAGLALAQDLTEADQLRLLGPPPAPAIEAPAPQPIALPAAAPAPVAAAPSSTGMGLGLPLLGLAAGAGLLWLGRRQQLLAPLQPTETLRVVGRAQIGKDAVVTLLDVQEAGGGWRRLMVGTGPQGPQLLTGLGTDAHHDLPEVPAFPVARAPVAPRPAPAAPLAATAAPPPRRAHRAEVPRPPEPTPTTAPRRSTPVARGGAPARSYAEVAAAWEPLDLPPAGPTLDRPQTRDDEPPPRSAREVLAMIESVRRRREAG